jgi:hypothetical protein
MLAYLCLHGFQKIPFTCSYLPGKSQFHMAFLGGLGVIFLILKSVEYERASLGNPASYFRMLLVLAVAAAVAGWRTVALAKAEEAEVQFEDAPAPEVFVLGLNRDGVLPTGPRQ